MIKYPTYEVTFAEENGEDRTWKIYVDLRLGEADALLVNCDYTWPEWVQALDRREPLAVRYLYWLALSRDTDDDVDFLDLPDFWLHQLAWHIIDGGDLLKTVDEVSEPKDDSIPLTGANPTEGVATESP